MHEGIDNRVYLGEIRGTVHGYSRHRLIALASVDDVACREEPLRKFAVLVRLQGLHHERQNVGSEHGLLLGDWVQDIERIGAFFAAHILIHYPVIREGKGHHLHESESRHYIADKSEILLIRVFFADCEGIGQFGNEIVKAVCNGDILEDIPVVHDVVSVAGRKYLYFVRTLRVADRLGIKPHPSEIFAHLLCGEAESEKSVALRYAYRALDGFHVRHSNAVDLHTLNLSAGFGKSGADDVCRNSYGFLVGSRAVEEDILCLGRDLGEFSVDDRREREDIILAVDDERIPVELLDETCVTDSFRVFLQYLVHGQFAVEIQRNESATLLRGDVSERRFYLVEVVNADGYLGASASDRPVECLLKSHEALNALRGKVKTAYDRGCENGSDILKTVVNFELYARGLYVILLKSGLDIEETAHCAGNALGREHVRSVGEELDIEVIVLVSLDIRGDHRKSLYEDIFADAGQFFQILIRECDYRHFQSSPLFATLSSVSPHAVALISFLFMGTLLIQSTSLL